MIVNVSYIIPSIHYSVFAITCFYIAIPLCSVQSLQILIFLQQISRIATILSCPYFFLAYFKVSELPTHAIGDGMDFGSQLLLYLYIKLIIAYIQSLQASAPIVLKLNIRAIYAVLIIFSPSLFGFCKAIKENMCAITSTVHPLPSILYR